MRMIMDADEKSKFRNRKAWKDFRKKMRKERKTDPITGSPLTKLYNLHHCDFNEEHYDNLDPNNFECLNSMSHDVVHFFFGVPGKLKNWRILILRTVKILKKMEALNRRRNEH